MTRKFRLLAGASILCSAVLAAPLGQAFAETAHSEPADGHATSALHWSYDGEADGPAAWGIIPAPEGDGMAYPVCGTGDGQSPIDLFATNAVGQISLETDYVAGALVLKPNSHTIEVTAPAGSSLTIGAVKYNLFQVHFHTPSEHVFNGEAYPMEAHFVHQNPATKQLAVLGVLFKTGDSNDQLEKILRKKGADDYDGQIGHMTFDPNALLPKEIRVLRYDGSLTTPPCSEGVNWNVAVDPIEASEDEIIVFKQYMGANARPAQVLNARPLVKPE
ncbi:carbonic anhydrase [Hyphomonas sp.]|uniref:carbonic anhydrase n=1 Tax=Hyphomonas sp. TaxID=87 RepID=UPI0035652DEC